MRVVWGLRYNVGKKVGVSLCRYFKHEEVFFLCITVSCCTTLYHVIFYMHKSYSRTEQKILEHNITYKPTS